MSGTGKSYERAIHSVDKAAAQLARVSKLLEEFGKRKGVEMGASGKQEGKSDAR